VGNFVGVSVWFSVPTLDYLNVDVGTVAVFVTEDTLHVFEVSGIVILPNALEVAKMAEVDLRSSGEGLRGLSPNPPPIPLLKICEREVMVKVTRGHKRSPIFGQGGSICRGPAD
jgi:hypothetical protein